MNADAIISKLAALDVAPRLVCDDSRRVAPGALFLAWRDEIADRRDHIGDAVAKGAIAVVWQPGVKTDGNDFVWPQTLTLPQLTCANLRQQAGYIAHGVLGEPSRKLSLIAVTGTNGKTSISQWIAQGSPLTTAVIGTLGAGRPGSEQATGFTTPEAATLASLLHTMANDGLGACALEASSIGLAEGRLNGAHLDVAVLSNISRDHLDYHGDWASYVAAKARLFTWPGLRLAVINADDGAATDFIRLTTAKQLIVTALDNAPSLAADADALWAEAIHNGATGVHFTLCRRRYSQRQAVVTKLWGRHNVANILAVAAVWLDQGLSLAEIGERLGRLTPPPGRLNALGGKAAPLVIVDYAHTPDGLDKVGSALAEIAHERGGRLLAVFGCGGDRDRSKRVPMRQAITRHAERCWVTSDNPRSESPQAIIDEIMTEASGDERARCQIEVDRRLAINAAIAAADANDVVALLGKGHETTQEIAQVFYPFNDSEVAKAALARWRPASEQTHERQHSRMQSEVTP